MAAARTTRRGSGEPSHILAILTSIAVLVECPPFAILKQKLEALNSLAAEHALGDDDTYPVPTVVFEAISAIIRYCIIGGIYRYSPPPQLVSAAVNDFVNLLQRYGDPARGQLGEHVLREHPTIVSALIELACTPSSPTTDVAIANTPLALHSLLQACAPRTRRRAVLDQHPTLLPQLVHELVERQAKQYDQSFQMHCLTLLTLLAEDSLCAPLVADQVLAADAAVVDMLVQMATTTTTNESGNLAAELLLALSRVPANQPPMRDCAAIDALHVPQTAACRSVLFSLAYLFPGHKTKLAVSAGALATALALFDDTIRAHRRQATATIPDDLVLATYVLRQLCALEANRAVLWAQHANNLLVRVLYVVGVTVAAAAPCLSAPAMADDAVNVLSHFSHDAKPLAWMRLNKPTLDVAFSKLSKTALPDAHKSAEFLLLFLLLDASPTAASLKLPSSLPLLLPPPEPPLASGNELPAPARALLPAGVLVCLNPPNWPLLLSRLPSSSSKTLHHNHAMSMAAVLYVAIELGAPLHVVRELVEKHRVPINGEIPVGHRSCALILAISRRRVDLALLLLEERRPPGGVDVNFEDYLGMTPLIMACFPDDFEPVVRRLLELGADVNRTPRNTGLCALEAACMACMRKGTTEWTEEQALAVTTEDEFDARRLRLVRLLLAHGASPNPLVPAPSRTLLMLAADQFDLALSRVLLEHGADIHLTVDGGRTAFQMLWKAVRSERCSAAKLLTTAKRTKAMRMAAVETRVQDAINLYAVEYGADLNATTSFRVGSGDKDDDCAMAPAAFFLSLDAFGDDVFMQLVELGADADTLLFAAVQQARVEDVKLLVQLGANPNACRNYGDDGLRSMGNNDDSTRGDCVVLLALKRQQHKAVAATDIIRVLLLAGADVHGALVGDNALPLLMLAVECGDVAAVRLLLQAGADKNQRVSGYSSYDVAVGKRRHELLPLLKADGDVDDGGLVTEGEEEAELAFCFTRCAQCRRPGTGDLQACSACVMVAYCSEECQLAHWKSNHRAICTQRQRARQSWVRRRKPPA